MSSVPTERSDERTVTIDRRRLLQGIAATGAASMVGVASATDRRRIEEPTDPAEIQEGGRLEFAIERPSIVEYDQVQSGVADDATVFNTVYDGLLTQDAAGEVLLWMAEEYEVVDAQDVGVEDYVDHMAEYEIVDVEGGVPFFDLEWPNLVLPGMFHPEDMEAVAEGDLGAGDEMRVLTREEAGDAVVDGVYGTMVRGRLHEGIPFHNGEECTAENIVRSHDRFVDSGLQGQVFDTVLHGETPDGPDGYEFELYSQEADAAAELQLPPFTIFPSDHFEIEPGGLDPRNGGEVPVGTGPYEVAEFEEGTQLLLERTDTYWLEEVGLDAKDWWDGPEDFPEGPVIDEINIRFVPEEGTRVAGLRDGDIDVTYELPPSENAAFDDDPDFTVNAAPSTGFKFMQFPVEDTEEGGAFAHQEVRQAVSHLIPRQDIVDIIDVGFGVPARVPFPEPAAEFGTTMTYDAIQEEEWAYPVEPDVETAEELIEESPLEPPIEMVIETNADDETRQDKVALIVDELNRSGLFDVVMETPADIGDWFATYLVDENSHIDYAERNACAVIGLAAGFDPHGYAEALHDPDNFNICCNFFFPEGTFDFMDLLRSARFGVDVATDTDVRRERYDELWPILAEESANVIVDFGEEVNVARPEVQDYGGYPDRRAFLTLSLYAPFNQRVAWLDR